MCPLPWEGLRASEPSSPDGLWPLALGPRLCTSGQNTLTHAATQQEATSHRTVTGQPPLHGDHKESTAMGPSGTDTAMCIQRPGALRRPRTGPLRPPPPSTVLLVCLPMSYPPQPPLLPLTLWQCQEQCNDGCVHSVHTLSPTTTMCSSSPPTTRSTVWNETSKYMDH